MLTLVPGNNVRGTRQFAPRAARGFTLIELMVVLAIVAISVAVVSLALRDPTLDRLERDATRLAALLEMARAEARTTGLPVSWVPLGASGDIAPAADPQTGAAAAQFRFIGLSAKTALPSGWLDGRVQAQVIGGTRLRLGPEAILPAQRVMLSLDAERIEVASDGIEAFAVVSAAAAATAARP